MNWMLFFSRLYVMVCENLFSSLLFFVKERSGFNPVKSCIFTACPKFQASECHLRNLIVLRSGDGINPIQFWTSHKLHVTLPFRKMVGDHKREESGIAE
ncbi:hypothetical protein TNIN_265811 [Trichonephila inaurata madagascariensis]|uniref:Secreted protein n=1 Tax=Trichonephila inaurata madagascariensis TaxID=2747483 RepID=A0A8X6WXX3_9ARAC|nr:hypothetical protein TNIN_265811 [Trichonephila inaurata madagascariensis]